MTGSARGTAMAGPPLTAKPAAVPVLYVDASLTVGGAPTSLALLLRHVQGVRPVVQYSLPESQATPFSAWDATYVPHWDPPVTGKGWRKDGARNGGVPALLHVGQRLWRQLRPAAQRTAALARASGARLIHCNNQISTNLPAILAARWLGIPCIVHHRGYERGARLPRALSRFVAHHICVSQSIADHLIAWGVPAAKVSVIHNGIAVEAGPPPRPCTPTVTVGAVGRFVRWKGLHVAVEAALRVAVDCPQARFMFVGGVHPNIPEYHAELEALVKAGPQADRIAFLGHRADAAALMQQMDILMHTSIEPEPCARVLLEGMAAGCAVVTTDVGGSPELVADGAGRVLPAGDVDALARELRALITDPAARRALQERGLAQVQARFSAARVARQVEGLYAVCLGTA